MGNDGHGYLDHSLGSLAASETRMVSQKQSLLFLSCFMYNK